MYNIGVYPSSDLSPNHSRSVDRFEKYLDEATRMYYFLDKSSGETLWTKPPRVPPDMACTDEGSGAVAGYGYEGGVEGGYEGGYGGYGGYGGEGGEGGEGGYDATGEGYGESEGYTYGAQGEGEGEGGYDASGYYDAYGASPGYDGTGGGGGGGGGGEGEGGFDDWGFADGSGGGGDPLAMTQWQADMGGGTGGGMLPMLGRAASSDSNTNNLLATQGGYAFGESLSPTQRTGSDMVVIRDGRGKGRERVMVAIHTYQKC